MWADGEPIDPSPSIDQAVNGGYSWLQRHSRCSPPPARWTWWDCCTRPRPYSMIWWAGSAAGNARKRVGVPQRRFDNWSRNLAAPKGKEKMPKINGAEAAGLTPVEANRIATSIQRDLDVLQAFCRRVYRLERSGFSKRFETDVPRVIA